MNQYFQARLTHLKIIKYAANSEFLYSILTSNDLLALEDILCLQCYVGVYKIRNMKNSTLGHILICNNRSCRKQQSLQSNSALQFLKLSNFFVILSSFYRNKTIASVVENSEMDETSISKYYKF